ncbi:MAG: ABC transporter ATP-binding protein [Eubacteriales bacterium]|jgi:Fe-S cluster assembly ATP-binding protein
MLELRNVSCVAEDADGSAAKEILKNVSLTIPDGKFVVITGPNGGGKSTLAKVIAGIYPISSGSIWLDGEDITQWSITQRAQAGISFAFQQPVRFKGITVRDLINLAAGEELTTAQVCNYLSEVGLCAREYVDREANASLSGGEIKRIEIAMIKARGTKFSIFDEPEAGIDLWSFQNLIDVFQKMRAQIHDSSIVIISHQERIIDIADDIVVMADGQIAAHGAKADILPQLMDGASCCKFCPRQEEV